MEMGGGRLMYRASSKTGWIITSPLLLFFPDAITGIPGFRNGKDKITDQNPRSSFINTTFTRLGGKHFSVMLQVLQMRSGLLQS